MLRQHLMQLPTEPNSLHLPDGCGASVVLTSSASVSRHTGRLEMSSSPIQLPPSDNAYLFITNQIDYGLQKMAKYSRQKKTELNLLVFFWSFGKEIHCGILMNKQFRDVNDIQ